MSVKHDANLLSAQLEPPGYGALVSVTNQLTDEQIALISRSRVGVELRLDSLLSEGVDLEREALRYKGIALLGTLRQADEGGTWDGSIDDKIALYQRMVPYLHGFDIELRSAGLERVIELGRKAGRLVVASSHHFDAGQPLSFPQLEYRYQTAIDAGANYFKIAAVTEDEDALAPMLGFMELNSGGPIIAVTIGGLGAQGRKRLLQLGSRATFIYVGNTPVVRGQLGLAEFVAFRGARVADQLEQKRLS